MFFSMIRLRQNVSPKDIAALRSGSDYQLHKLIWNIFSDRPDRKRDFLYRYESVNGWPSFYTVSAREPEDSSGLWEMHPKKYDPKLTKGERLAFSLRVNPIRSKRDENNRQHRHDVVMEAKTKLNFKEMPHDKRPHVAELIQDSGFAWLKGCEAEKSFSVNETDVRVDGYNQQKLFKGKGAKPVTFSTLDFNGILIVTNPNTFIKESLYKGIGPAKAFGCGLMMVRRI